MPRVAQVVAPGAIGGVETVVAELLGAAQRAPADMLCIALLPESAPLPLALQSLASTGVRLVRVPAVHRQYLTQYRALRVAIRESGAQVVHTHGYHADILAGMAARSLGLAHVATLHGFVGSNARGRFYEWLQLRSLRYASAVIAVSQPIADRTIGSGVPASHVHVVRNAAPRGDALSVAAARETLGLSGETPRIIGWVGRMSAEKQPARFVELVNALNAADVPVVGIMLGDGPQMAPVRAQAADLLAAGLLHLPGAVAGAGRLLPAFDALVLTSTTEGTPMVVLEAMRAGVPVISTAVGGVPDMLAFGAGLLVPSGDMHGLAEAVQSVLSDASLAEELQRTGQRRASEEYGADRWWDRHAAIYGALAG